MAIIEKQTGALAAAAVVALSPKARQIARQGAVYGLAGALKAGDVLVGAGRGAYEGARAGLEGSAASTPRSTASPRTGGATRSARSSGGRKTGSRSS
jgi:hypothetical protein